jgi:hypothetical protein
MKRAFCLTFVLLAIGTTCAAQGPPKRIWGKWRIRREVPTLTVSCWCEREVRAILGTEIEYTAESFRWKNVITRHPSTEVANVSAEQFHAEHSGQGVNSSEITFQQLGIKAAQATQSTIKHPDANVTGATTEIPGMIILLTQDRVSRYPSAVNLPDRAVARGCVWRTSLLNNGQTLRET